MVVGSGGGWKWWLVVVRLGVPCWVVVGSGGRWWRVVEGGGGVWWVEVGGAVAPRAYHGFTLIPVTSRCVPVAPRCVSILIYAFRRLVSFFPLRGLVSVRHLYTVSKR